MRKKKRKISIQIILALVIIALSPTILAEDELQVKGAAVYVVYTAPLFDDSDLFEYYNYSEGIYEPPYISYKKRHKEPLDENLTRIADNPNCKNITGFDYFNWVSCIHDDIEFFYDGYWLVGRKNLTGKDELRNLSELYRLTWDYSRDITNLIEDDTFRNELVLQNTTKTRFLTYIHLNEIIPDYLAEGDIPRISGSYKFNLNRSYQEQICEYLSENVELRQGCLERMTSLYFPIYDKPDKFKYLLRVRADNMTQIRTDYNKFVVIMEAEDGAGFLDHFIPPVSYLILEDKVRVYISNLLEETENLQKNLSSIRTHLRDGTKMGLTADSRINNSIAIRAQLDLKEDELENITTKINEIKSYHESRTDQISNLPFYRMSDRLLFEKENRDRLNSLGNDISESQGYKDQIERTLNILWDNYHDEYMIAEDENTSRELNEANLFVITLAVLAIFVNILVTGTGSVLNKKIAKMLVICFTFFLVIFFLIILFLLSSDIFPSNDGINEFINRYLGLVICFFISLLSFLVLIFLIQQPTEDLSGWMETIKFILIGLTVLVIFLLFCNVVKNTFLSIFIYPLGALLIWISLWLVVSKREEMHILPSDNEKLDKISKEVSESSVESRKLFESLLRSQRSSLAAQERMIGEQRNTEETLKRLSDSFKEETGVLEGKLDGISHEYRDLEDDFEDLSNSLDELRRRFGLYGDESS